MRTDQELKAEYEELKGELVPQITAASLYPEDAVLPEDAFLVEAITLLREREPAILKMGMKPLFDEVWMCTQRIQTFAYDKKCPMDERFLPWAQSCASKVIMRRRLIEETPAERRRLIDESLPKTSGIWTPLPPNTKRVSYSEPKPEPETKFSDAPTFRLPDLQDTAKLAVRRAVVKLPDAQRLVELINKGFDDAVKAGRTLLRIARDTGNLLHEWKALVGHGNWIRAYEESGFDKDIRTAQNWMKLSALTDAEIDQISTWGEAFAKLEEKGEKKRRAKPTTGEGEEQEPILTIDDVVAEPEPVSEPVYSVAQLTKALRRRSASFRKLALASRARTVPSEEMPSRSSKPPVIAGGLAPGLLSQLKPRKSVI